MSTLREYKKDPSTGRWVKQRVSQPLAQPVVHKATRIKTEEEYKESALRDFELVSKFLREDPESPTGLVWAIDNHSMSWLASHKVAGEVAGTQSKSYVNIKGIRIERLRAILMLRTETPWQTHCADTGKPYRFIQSASGYIKAVTWEVYKEMAYGGQRGKRKV